MKFWIDSFFNLLFPNCCLICDTPLHSPEEKICLRCDMNLPRTNYHKIQDNPVEKLLWGRIRFEKATSFLFYNRGSSVRQLLYQLKYNGNYQLGVTLGKQIASELSLTHFLDDIDIIIPVPLHEKKLKKRGYNQSEAIARGISTVINKPVNTITLTRNKNTETQTQKTVLERWENVSDIFTLHQPEQLSGKHILLIDDVLTTGATLTVCASQINKIPDSKVSLLTLAVASH